METKELDLEERRHIQNLSVIPAVIVMYVFIGYLIYLIKIDQNIQPTFYLPYLLVVCVLAMPAAAFLSQEILYARKTHASLTSALKRFVRKMSIAVIGAVLFAVIFEMDNFALSSLINQNGLLVITGIIWFVVWALLVLRFRRILTTIQGRLINSANSKRHRVANV